MLQLILPPTENVLPGNKERRTNEKNRITPPWRKYLEQRQPFYRMDGKCSLPVHPLLYISPQISPYSPNLSKKKQLSPNRLEKSTENIYLCYLKLNNK